ncbi:MAG: serpin family protein, partial [Clostridiaceae bacterium]|nr:serpin family protein [Clostridiaceae bacterium]
CELAITVPKFTYRSSINLLEALEPISVITLLQTDPDFSGLLKEESDADPYVSKIDQQSFIAFEEGGIEAAAMTLVEVSDECAMMPIEIKLDRPFIYVIEDDAGAPLFVGIVRNPQTSRSLE